MVQFASYFSSYKWRLYDRDVKQPLQILDGGYTAKNDQIKLIPFNNHTKHEVILVFKYLPEFFKAFLPQPFALKQSVFSGRLDECKNTVG